MLMRAQINMASSGSGNKKKVQTSENNINLVWAYDAADVPAGSAGNPNALAIQDPQRNYILPWRRAFRENIDAALTDADSSLTCFANFDANGPVSDTALDPSSAGCDKGKLQAVFTTALKNCYSRLDGLDVGSVQGGQV